MSTQRTPAAKKGRKEKLLTNAKSQFADSFKEAKSQFADSDKEKVDTPNFDIIEVVEESRESSEKSKMALLNNEASSAAVEADAALKRSVFSLETNMEALDPLRTRSTPTQNDLISEMGKELAELRAELVAAKRQIVDMENRPMSSMQPGATFSLPQRGGFTLSSEVPQMNGSREFSAANNVSSNQFMPVVPRNLHDLPSFDGSAEDWPMFEAAFEQTTAVYGYNQFENCQRLQKSLKGSAHELVKSLLIHPDNVSSAMAQLKFRFGRPELLIRHHIAKIKDLPAIAETAIEKIVPFATEVTNLAAILRTLQAQQHLYSPTLIEELIMKLPMSKRMAWAERAQNIKPYPSVIDFSEWLYGIANLICAVHIQDPKPDSKRRTVLHTNSESAPIQLKCYICQGEHKITACEKFKALSISERWEKAKKERLCFGCLKKGHATRDCRKKAKCPIENCGKSHHKLLHEVKKTESKEIPSKNEKPMNNEAVLSCMPNNSASEQLYFRVLPVTLYGQNCSINTFALFDEGSSVTMMDDELMRQLRLSGSKQTLNVQWYGGESASQTADLVNVGISSKNGHKRYELRNVYCLPNLNLPRQSVDVADLPMDNVAYEVFPMESYKNAKPQLLIGLDNCHLGVPNESLQLTKTGPFLALTKLGWVIYGPKENNYRYSKSKSETSLCLFAACKPENELQSLVAEYFSIENFGVKPTSPIESEENKRAQHILEATTVRVGTQFQTGLLWKEDNVKMPPSYAMAKNRLKGLHRKFKKDPELAAAYVKIIKEYIEKGYARKLPSDEAANETERTWYLPHFPVRNPNKPEKVRLVFDAAAISENVSLNSKLLKGPLEYQQLQSVLFGFRKGVVAVCGDIREMFHQVKIQPSDTCAQRFLWSTDSESDNPDVYEMSVMIFGAACSPAIALHVKDLNARQHTQHSPRAIKAILEHHYVDDFVDSFDSVNEAKNISAEVRDIHASAGFEMRSFSSNSPEVTTFLQGETDAVNFDQSVRNTQVKPGKVLGMRWQPADDIFEFLVKTDRIHGDIINGSRPPTKREILSIMMSVFDPLGFLCHFMIRAKFIIRELWRHSVSWDEPLSEVFAAACVQWLNDLKKIDAFAIPRHYFQQGQPKNLQLHVFMDSSQDAMCAVAYWRYENDEGETDLTFICAKTKCAPLKPLTIPRLELQAAVLGTRLGRTVVEQHDLRIDSCVFWSDSKTVLRWLRSSSRRYKPFVAFRVAEILDSTEPLSWRWLPSEMNIADKATHVNRQMEFDNDSPWYVGPEFLRRRECEWPVEEICTREAVDEEEICKPIALLTVSNHNIDFLRFSSFYKLKRCVAWMIRFVSQSRKMSRETLLSLTLPEVEKAETILLLLAQRDAYNMEMGYVREGKYLPSSHHLHTLMPYMDENGLLRVKGRIDAASWLPYSAKRPIILPPTHALTKLILMHYHREMKHQNFEATICQIRSRFWVPGIRRCLQKIIRNCPECKINHIKPDAPIMGSLPEDRLTPYIRPFTYTGVDYFGPVLVTIGRRNEKRWVALFTCLTTRAIHLEIAFDLSTDACILAMRNFMNRRGVPTRIRSDNGKNFVGADAEAKRFDEVFNCERIQDELTSKGIQWIFNCPSNPSEGGIWERMVQCVKRVLSQTLKEVAPREHTLQTLLIEAERIVNSRPLTHLPMSPDQEEPLTPNHFLIGSANIAPMPSISQCDEKQPGLRKQWRIAQQLRNHFWKRWVSEYLPTLTRRTKWCQPAHPIAEGDVVFICDPNMPRKQWCRGIVQKLYHGADGIARRADIRTSDGILRRPVSKVAVLDTVRSESA